MRLPFLLVLALLALPVAAGTSRAADAPPGATSCSGCHPMHAKVNSPVTVLAGRKAAEIAAAMGSYRDGAWVSTIMTRIAKGFTDIEIDAIADWYAKQKP